MKKFNLPVLIGEIAFFAIYSLFIFVAGSKEGFGNGSFILPYVMMAVVGTVNVLLVGFLSNKYKNRDKSISDFGLFYPAEIIAFLAMFGLSLIFYIARPETMKISIILVCVILILYAAYFVLIGYVVGAQNKNRDHVAKKVFAIRSLVVTLESAIDASEDAVVRGELEQLRDDVRFSDPMSADELADVDAQLSSLANEISNLVSEKKVAETSEKIAQMSRLVKERNRKCKMLK